MVTPFDEKSLCCGCTSCVVSCPTKAILMQEEEEGFLYPCIDKSKCCGCNICKKVCPIAKGFTKDKLKYLDNPLVYAVKHKNDEVRKNSSSGGMFSALSDYILDQNGIVFGAAYDDNIKAYHIRAETKEQCKPCAGSKYVQSDMASIYSNVKTDLLEGRKVMFTGTPCQVDGLLAFLGWVDRSGLITVDVICHGVPSPGMFEKYLRFCESKKKQRVVAYYNRSKDRGWGHVEKTVYENGDIDYTSSLSQAWKYMFYSNLMLRPSCYRCQYAQNERISDITIADFWGIENTLPEFYDKNGVSLVLVNTETGASALKSVSNMLVIKKSSIEACSKRQGSLRKPAAVDPVKRSLFWKENLSYGIKYIVKKYGRCNIRGILKNYLLDQGRWYYPIINKLYYKIKF